MRKLLLALLLISIVIYAPWRLLAVLAEVPFVSTTSIRLAAGNTRYWDVKDLEQQLATAGWTVTYMPLRDGYAGWTDGQAHSISIDETLSWNERLATLAHEAGHTRQPAWCSHNQCEAYAELVGTLLAHDGLREHARYLARMRGDTYLLALTEWRSIYRTAELYESQ